jgi:hypothetical protein
MRLFPEFFQSDFCLRTAGDPLFTKSWRGSPKRPNGLVAGSSPAGPTNELITCSVRRKVQPTSTMLLFADVVAFDLKGLRMRVLPDRQCRRMLETMDTAGQRLSLKRVTANA